MESSIEIELQNIKQLLFKCLSFIPKEVTNEENNVGLKNDCGGYLEFTNKEINSMPRQFRNTFRVQGKTVHYRVRQSGRYVKSYEIRYAKKPFNLHPLSVSAGTLLEVKARFIEKLNSYVEHGNNAFTIPSNFNEFAMYWFENFHKRKVIEKTYINNLALYNRHLKAKFDGLQFKDIIPTYVQDILDGLPGNGKTADDARSILNQIFEAAVNHGLIKLNPLNLFVHTAHERQTGTELTKDEELKLLDTYKGTVYEIIYAVLLYTGLRPNEYKTAKIENGFIVAVNSKRKNGKVEYKKIPIIEPLRERLNGITTLPCRHEVNIRINFNAVFQNHTLKDLRKTFGTRCVEHRIDYFARKKFMGQSVGRLDGTYIGNLDDYLFTEGEKLNDWYTLPQKCPK